MKTSNVITVRSINTLLNFNQQTTNFKSETHCSLKKTNDLKFDVSEFYQAYIFDR